MVVALVGITGCIDDYRIQHTYNDVDNYEIYTLGSLGILTGAELNGIKFFPRKVLTESSSSYALKLRYKGSTWFFIKDLPIRTLITNKDGSQKTVDLDFIRDISSDVVNPSSLSGSSSVYVVEEKLYSITKEQLTEISEAKLVKVRVSGKSSYEIVILDEHKLGYLKRFLTEPFNEKDSL